MQVEIFEALKTVLRARKITYAQLAQRLGTSEPTIKRIFSARDDKLSRIVEICDALDLSLEDLVVQANRTEVKPIFLGDRVERQLAEDPALFRLLILLQDGISSQEIERQLDLNPEVMFRYGRRLEALGLVEVHEAGRVKLTAQRPIKFRRDGPLHRELMNLNLDFVKGVFLRPDSENAGFVTQSRRISAPTARHMMEALRQLSRELSDMARRDQLTLPSSDLHSFKLTAAWSPVTFSELLSIDVSEE